MWSLILLYENYLYYIIGDEFHFETGSFTYADRIKLSDIKKYPNEVVDKSKSGNSTGNISNEAYVAIQGEYIYKNGLDGKLYRSNLDGSDKRVIVKSPGATQINVLGDWVYYVMRDSSYPPGPSQIYRVKEDGTQDPMLVSLLEKDDIYNLNVVGDWIYYINSKDNNTIYKVKTDGTERTKLFAEPVYSMNVVGDKIYFTGGSLEQFYTIKYSGSIASLNVKGKELIVTPDKIKIR